MFENFGFSNDKYGLLSCIYIELLYTRSTPPSCSIMFWKKPLLIVADSLSYGFKKKHRRHGSKGYF
jgi:hypothetical protein